MASALLASSNEPCWGEPNVYMRKNPLSNPNPRSHANLYPGDRAAARFRLTEMEDVQPGTATAVSDDSSSFNRRPAELDHRRDLDAGGGSGYVRFNISTYSKREMRELKRRLVSELDEVQSFISRIQSRDIPSSARSGGFSASGIYGGGREVTSSAAARQSLDPVPSRPSDPLFPKGNKVSGSKPSLPAASPREPKRLALAPESEKLHAIMMKKCSQILSKMMKHKKSIWFNSPVDVVGMGLHDYFQIIKTPMDLGTVKRKLNKTLYLSPAEFASDVRLTFNNALVYNPAGHEVHKLADQFLRHFESLFVPAYQKYEKQLIAMEQEEPRFSAISRLPVPEVALRSDPPVPMARIPSPVPASPPAPPSPPLPLPVNENKHPQPQPQPQIQQRLPNVSRAASVRLPKPKAKDPNKRPMNFDEKQKLSEGLQSLPPEKMPQVLSIVKKRNANALENGDEIELDIDIMDTETLWELDRFLSNCKKLMSKMKRQEAIASGLVSAAQSHSHSVAAAPPLPPAEGIGDLSPMSVDAKRCKKGDTAAVPAEEDVDIGDELPGTNYPSVEIQKDAGCASSSSSSSSDSDSSSSSDSDSGSSSDSDSDNEEGGRHRRSP